MVQRTAHPGPNRITAAIVRRDILGMVQDDPDHPPECRDIRQVFYCGEASLINWTRYLTRLNRPYARACTNSSAKTKTGAVSIHNFAPSKNPHIRPMRILHDNNFAISCIGCADAAAGPSLWGRDGQRLTDIATTRIQHAQVQPTRNR